jgi:hypothetical protein
MSRSGVVAWLHRTTRRLAGPRKAFGLRMVPVAGSGLSRRADDPGAWLCAAGRPWFSLAPAHRDWPEGWVLLESQLNGRMTRDFSARLALDLGSAAAGERVIPVPVPKKGTVQELVFLPKGLANVRWSPIGAAGSFEQAPMRMRQVGVVERNYLMGRRVWITMRSQPTNRLLEAGVDWLRFCVDPQGAYAACGRLRAYSPPIRQRRWVERFAEGGHELDQVHPDALVESLEWVSSSLMGNGGLGRVSDSERMLLRKHLLPTLIAWARRDDAGQRAARASDRAA